MRIHNHLEDKTYTAKLTTEHACSSYGQPVVVLANGEALDRFSWGVYSVVKATDQERAALEAAGYPVKEA